MTAAADEKCEDCGPPGSLGLWLLAGGAALVLVGLDLLTGGKILGWLPIPALFGSATAQEAENNPA